MSEKTPAKKAPHYLKWLGGKRKLAPKILELFGGPCKGGYVEPFVGSAAVFLEASVAGHKRGALLSDVNPALITVHKAIRDRPQEVIKELDDFCWEEDVWRDQYYDVRDTFNEKKLAATRESAAIDHLLGDEWSESWMKENSAEFAAMFLWINRASFNGLYRENLSGKFNVPIGRYKRPTRVTSETIIYASQLLQRAKISCGSFKNVIPRCGFGDHIYADPPYAPASDTANFVGYSKHGFTWEDHQDLARLMSEAADRGARVLISNADLPIVRELYMDFGFSEITEISVQRSVGAKSRGRAPEIIAGRTNKDNMSSRL